MSEQIRILFVCEYEISSSKKYLEIKYEISLQQYKIYIVFSVQKVLEHEQITYSISKLLRLIYYLIIYPISIIIQNNNFRKRTYLCT